MIKAAFRSSVVRFGIRRFCNNTTNYCKETSDKVRVVHNDVSERDIEAMFDYSVDNEIISDHWDDAMDVIKKSEEVYPSNKPTEEDLLSIRATRPTMTLGSLVNESKTLQSLVDLGVSLHRWDKYGHLGLAAKLDFVRDVAPVIRFLADLGVEHDQIGKILSHSPGILEETEQDLKTRVAYLVSKKFKMPEIAHIVSTAPRWLCFSVRSIDARLGFFQKTFDFVGNEVRAMTLGDPALVTWNGTPDHVKKVIFSYNEEMGFSKEEIKAMTLINPRILKVAKEALLLEQFDLLHNVAKIPHEILAKFPESLLKPKMITKPRILFLESLGRAQFDPNKPNYVSPEMLTINGEEGGDIIFCEKVAKCPVELFDKFQKTL